MRSRKQDQRNDGIRRIGGKVGVVYAEGGAVGDVAALDLGNFRCVVSGAPLGTVCVEQVS